MSAIWGIFSLESNTAISENYKEIFESEYKKRCKIDRMESVAVNGGYVGCAIQYITEESQKEVLPIYDGETGIVFTADCILDNRKEVIELLAKEIIADKEYQATQDLSKAPDGTLMYLMYKHYGIDCARHFRGLFSIAVWEQKKRRLTLISDHVSARCLYYVRNNDFVAFSTIMSPLHSIFPENEQNIDYYKDFLLADTSLVYVVPEATPFKGIYLMKPASYVAFSSQSVVSDIYWTPADCCDKDKELRGHKKKTAEQYGKHFMSIYRACVKDALRTSGQVGIAMSSGLDSTSVGVLAAGMLEKQKKELYSYTFVPYEEIDCDVSKDGTKVYDESFIVREIGEMYPNIRMTFLNNHGKNIFEDMKTCSEIMEFPYKTGPFPNHFEMCQEGALRGCRVFLNGGFGNTTVSFGEIQNILYDLYSNKHYIKLLMYLNKYGKQAKVSRKELLKRVIKGFHNFNMNSKEPLKNYKPVNPFISQKILKDYDLVKRFSKNRRLLVARGFVDKSRYYDFLNSDSLLIYSGVFETKFGLSNGMLIRDPTKDSRMMEFCANLPYEYFAHNGMSRWLIRNNFANLLPKSVTGVWEQRGLLNCDWIDRIHRDWDVLKPKLLDDLNSGYTDGLWIREKVIRFIELFGSETINGQNEQRYLEGLCAIECLSVFMTNLIS